MNNIVWHGRTVLGLNTIIGDYTHTVIGSGHDVWGLSVDCKEEKFSNISHKIPCQLYW